MFKIVLVEDGNYSCKDCAFSNKENLCILGLIEDFKDIKLFETCGQSHYEVTFGGKNE